MQTAQRRTAQGQTQVVQTQIAQAQARESQPQLQPARAQPQPVHLWQPQLEQRSGRGTPAQPHRQCFSL